MLMFQKPSIELIRHFLAREATLPYTYRAIGTTATTPPKGYVVDHSRIWLGEGRPVFEAAKTALQRWEQFRLGWTEAWPTDLSIREGEVVAIVARIAGFWWLNSTRIVYVIDESGPLRRFGFAYGTLPGHAESGEERFLIEWNRDDDTVWYDLLAFSRPNHMLVRLGYPFVRRLQKRFARDSGKAMLQAVRTRVHEGMAK